MRIGSRELGDGHPPYVIAELGVNHDGSVDRARELVELAATAGADAVKFQLFRADLLMSRAAKLAAYQKAAGESDPIEMLRRLELSVDQLAPLVDLAHRHALHAIVTVFSVELVDEAKRLAWDAYKTASPDIVHTPLLKRLEATGKALILSTGASTLDEVTAAVGELRSAHERLAVLQCVSSYPTPREHAELGGIDALRHAFPHLVVGYSDHTPDETTALDAVRLGACVLEKHFTHSRAATGPDHAASLEPDGLRAYGHHAREAWRAKRAGKEERTDRRGAAAITALKRVLPIEQDVRTVSRQSIVARRDLRAGERLSAEDLTFKRPGTGLWPCRFERVVGGLVLRDVQADMPLTEADVGTA